jgi:predicted  nucleic acid-binding Zn-ribbon protein
MDQYTEQTPPKPAALPVPQDAKELDTLRKRIVDLTTQVTAQQEQIQRMHRDIVRIRESINQVAARIRPQ